MSPFIEEVQRAATSSRQSGGAECDEHGRDRCQAASPDAEQPEGDEVDADDQHRPRQSCFCRSAGQPDHEQTDEKESRLGSETSQ